MLISGRISNEVKNQFDFLSEILDKKRQEEAEKAKILARAEKLKAKTEEVANPTVQEDQA